MDNLREIIAQEHARISAKSDDWTESDRDYAYFVNVVVKKHSGKYRNGIAKFSNLANLEVELSSNETKYHFSFGNNYFGRVFSSEEADDVLTALKKVDGMLD